jgi:hypothetical protein
MLIFNGPLGRPDQAEVHVVIFSLVDEQLALVTGDRGKASLLDGCGPLLKPFD